MVFHFGDIRAFFQNSPTFNQKQWKHLCDMLIEWPDHQELHEVVLPYVRAHVERWPESDRHRETPKSWFRYMKAHKRVPVGIHLFSKLNFRDGLLPPGHVRAIVHSPDVAHIQFIDMTGCRYGDEVCFAIANSPHMGKLQRLYLDNNRVTANGLLALLNSPHLSQLKVIKATENYIRKGCRDDLVWAHEILEDSTHPQLDVLDLSHNGCADAWFIDVIAHPAVRTVRELTLIEGYIDDEGLTTLANAHDYPNLNILRLGIEQCTSDAAYILGNASHLNQLESLWFGTHAIESAYWSQIYDAPHLRHMRKTLKRLLHDNYNEDIGSFYPYNWDW